MAEDADQIFVILKHWLVAHLPLVMQPIVAAALLGPGDHRGVCVIICGNNHP